MFLSQPVGQIVNYVFVNYFAHLVRKIGLKVLLKKYVKVSESSGPVDNCWTFSGITLICNHINKELDLPFTLLEGHIGCLKSIWIGANLKIVISGIDFVVCEKGHHCDTSDKEDPDKEKDDHGDKSYFSFNPTDRILEEVFSKTNCLTIDLEDVQFKLLTQRSNDSAYLKTLVKIASGAYHFAGIFKENDFEQALVIESVQVYFGHSEGRDFESLPLILQILGKLDVSSSHVPNAIPEVNISVKCGDLLACLQPQDVIHWQEQVETFLAVLPKAEEAPSVDTLDPLVESQIFEDAPDELHSDFSSSKLKINCQVANLALALLYENVSEMHEQFFYQLNVPDVNLSQHLSRVGRLCAQNHLMLRVNAFRSLFKRSLRDLGSTLEFQCQFNALQLCDFFNEKPVSTLIDFSHPETPFQVSMELASQRLGIDVRGSLAKLCLDMTLEERISSLQHSLGLSSPSEEAPSETNIQQIVISASIQTMVADVLFPVPECSLVNSINAFSQKFRQDYLSLEATDMVVKAFMADCSEPGSELTSASATCIDIYFHHSNRSGGCPIGKIVSPYFSINVPRDQSPSAQGVEDLPVVCPRQQKYQLSRKPKVPIDTNKMKAFVDHHVDCSLYKLKASAAAFDIIIPSKNVLEILYNRLAADLLLWQPQYMRLASYKAPPLQVPSGDKTLFSSHIEVQSMTLLIRAPYREQNEEVVLDFHGDFCLRAQNVFLGIVSGFRGDPNVTYVIFEVPSDLWALHCPRSDVKSYWPISESSFDCFKKVISTVDMKPMNVCPNSNYKCDQALSLVVRTEFDVAENISTIETVGQCSQWVAFHFMERPKYDYISQLVEMLCLEDYPIEGYVLPTVKNEFQFAIHHFQLDYVPLGTNHAVRLLLGNGRIQVSADLNQTTTIDICSSDLYLALAQKKKWLKPCDYIPVIRVLCAHARLICGESGLRDFTTDLGMLELFFCADTFNAFITIITYILEYGDLPRKKNKEAIPVEVPPSKCITPTLDVGLGPGVHTQKDIDQLELTMVEATEDILDPSPRNDYCHVDLSEFELPDDSTFHDLDLDLEECRLVAGDQPIVETCGYIRVNIRNKCVLPKAPGSGEDLPPHVEKFGENYDYTQQYVPVRQKQSRPVKSSSQDVRMQICLKVSPQISIYGGHDFNAYQTFDVRRKVKLGDNANPEFRLMGMWMEKGGFMRNRHEMVRVNVDDAESSLTYFNEGNPYFWDFRQRIGRFSIDDNIRSSTVKKIIQITQKERKSASLDIFQLFVGAAQSKLLNENVSHTISLHLLPLDMCLDQDTLIFLQQFYENISEMDSPVERRPVELVETSQQEEPSFYIEKFEFRPSMYIDLTYVAKRVNLRAGQNSFVSLLLGLSSFEDARITLKRVTVANISSLPKLAEQLFSLWQKDIRTNQSNQVISGLKPIGIFVRMFEGVAGLVNVPMHQYSKDGRIVRGIVKGSQLFTYSYSLALLELLERIFGFMQVLAESVNELVAINYRQSATKKVAAKDFASGFSEAQRVVSVGLGQTYSGILESASRQDQNRSLAGAVGNILRHTPLVLTEPTLYVAEAAQEIIGAAKSHISPEARKRAENRFKK